METTRDRILDAALRLFHEHGYRGATTAEIARQASVAEGTIYRYFKDKKELFLACVEPVIQEAISRELSLSREGKPRDIVRRRIVERFRVIKENLAVFHIIFTESRYHPEIARILLAQVAAKFPEATGLAGSKTLRRPVNPLFLSVGLTASIWALVSAGQLASEDDTLAPSRDLENEIADFFCDALFRDETI